MGKRTMRTYGAQWCGDAFPPPCACGCGEPTKVRDKDGFQKYVDRQHQAWDKDYTAVSDARRRLDHARGIPVTEFRAAIRKIQQEKGWTLTEIAERGGQQPGWLNTYMYADPNRTIGRSTARAFLRRLAGLPELPSRWQQREFERHERLLASVRD